MMDKVSLRLDEQKTNFRMQMDATIRIASVKPYFKSPLLESLWMKVAL
jgi:hypothetical protein